MGLAWYRWNFNAKLILAQIYEACILVVEDGTRINGDSELDSNKEVSKLDNVPLAAVEEDGTHLGKKFCCSGELSLPKINDKIEKE